MVISGIALSILGQTFFARGLLVGLTYGILHNYSWIPRKVHLFKETWSPLIESVGMLYTGTLFNRIYAIFQGLSFFPSCKYFLQGKLDLFMSQKRDPFLFDKHGEPLLIDIDKSFNRPKDLTYEEIENIKKQRYENLMSFIEKGIVAWNSPHFTNPIGVDLPGDHDFDKLLSSFKRVDWADSKRFSILERKLLAEDRFIDFIHEQLPHLTKKEIKRNISSYIEILAKKEGISNKEYAIKWVTEQMSILVDILNDKKTGKGSQQNLLYAIDTGSKIVFYLEQIKKNTGKKIEYEDILLKLALEAGNYCNIGIKRAFDEIYTQILYEHFKQLDSDVEQLNPDLEQFELKLLYSLEDCRYKIVAGKYQQALHVMAKNGQGQGLQDIHLFNLITQCLKLGFYPLTKEERKSFGLTGLVYWTGVMKPMLTVLYTQYEEKLFSKIEEVGNESNYILYKVIGDNRNLDKSQKEELANWYSNISGEDNYEDITLKSRILLLLKIGVLKLK